ncbi:MAG: hypothetical protein WA708_01855 [Acidobacteriaceae bacterium]
MSFVTAAICDVCKRQKGEANHWLLGYPHLIHFHAKQVAFYGFAAWNENASKESGVTHICSEECAHKLLAKYLTPAKSKDEVRARDVPILNCPAERRPDVPQWEPLS